MARHKMSTEERHKKQKEKLDKRTVNTTDEIKFIQQKNFKVEVVEKAQKAGFSCIVNNDSLVIFSNDEDEKKVTDWLLKQFGREEEDIKTGAKVKRIPLSFGFSKIEKQNQPTQSTVNAAQTDDLI